MTINLIAIDPGDKYTGVAFFERVRNGVWTCIDAQEFQAEDDFDVMLLETLLDPTESVEYVVYERFRLYQDKSVEQTGSEFATAQLIGVIKFIHKVQDRHMDLHDEVDQKGSGKMLTCELSSGHHSTTPPHRIVLHGQMADIKKPITGILKKKKIKSTAKPISRELYKGRDHVVDAELHGAYYIMRELKETLE